MDEHARALADAVEAALPGWVVRSVEARAEALWGPGDDSTRAAAAEAGRRAQAEVGPEVRRLLEADFEAQWTTPLALLRQAVRYPTEVLAEAGVPPAERDEHQRRLFPDDLYDLSPAALADVDPSLAEPGLAWGAAKAWSHLQRHRPGSRAGR